jgi:hypothetical protein
MICMQGRQKALQDTVPYHLNNPKKHRNWRHFTMIYEACRMQGWDAKLYIESQFKRSEEQNKNGIPWSDVLR